MSTLAIVGNQSFPLARGAGHILRMMRDLPKDTVIYVRGDAKYEPIAGVDALVVVFAGALHLKWYAVGLSPVIGSKRGWNRDEYLVESANEVWTFHDPDKSVSGGTANIVHIALNKDKKIFSYSLTEDDRLVEFGSHTPAPTKVYVPSPVTGKWVVKTGPTGTLSASYSYDES